MKKVLFYTGIPRVFRTTLIGHLHEISQVYPTVLLSEKLDLETEKILNNKELFPNLEKIIPVRQFASQKINLPIQNKYFYKLTKDIIRHQKPDIIIAPSDMYSFLELYLMRFAKRTKSLKISLQSTLFGSEMKEQALWMDLINIHSRMPSFLPFWSRFFLRKCRQYSGHLLYYWIFPLLVGEVPFFGKSSRIIHKGNDGMRDADYQIVFSKRDYDFFLKDGVPAEKLYILSHPLERETKRFFKKTFLSSTNRYKDSTRIVTLVLPPENIGFRKDGHSLISKEEMQKYRVEIVSSVVRILKGWKIFIKPHPMIQDIKEIKNTFESLSGNVKVTESKDPIDKYIGIADLVIGLPLSVSTVLLTTSLQYPDKPIISLDFRHELLGDTYKDFEGIEYIDKEEKFLDVLKLIRDNKYHKEYKHKEELAEELKLKKFSNTIKMLEDLFNKQLKLSPKVRCQKEA